MEETKNSFTQSRPQLVYGKCIYWLSITAAMICAIGPVIAMEFPNSNIMNPHYLFYSIWEGKNPEAVWEEVGGGFPGGHLWLHNLTSGDGFIQFGLVIGCSCACVALIGAAIVYLKEKPRAYRWALLSLWVAAMIILSALGIYQA